MSMSVQMSQVHKTATRSQDDDKRLCLVDDLKEVQVHIQVKPIKTSSSLKYPSGLLASLLQSLKTHCLRYVAEKLNNDLIGRFSHEARRLMVQEARQTQVDCGGSHGRDDESDYLQIEYFSLRTIFTNGLVSDNCLQEECHLSLDTTAVMARCADIKDTSQDYVRGIESPSSKRSDLWRDKRRCVITYYSRTKVVKSNTTVGNTYETVKEPACFADGVRAAYEPTPFKYAKHLFHYRCAPPPENAHAAVVSSLISFICNLSYMLLCPANRPASEGEQEKMRELAK
ncbi:hypothetical protein Tco_0103932 [Tanacetum coccineum]